MIFLFYFRPQSNKDDELSYYVVDDLYDKIVFVDSDETANSMLQYIDDLSDSIEANNEGIPVGLDMEWKSVCMINEKTPPALFQIGFDNRVYLVDMIELHSRTTMWMDLSEKLFKNDNFLKLGSFFNFNQF